MQFPKGHKLDFFDIATVAHEENATEPRNLKDRMDMLFFKNYLKYDFGYITKGIKNTEEGFEYMYIGEMNLCKKTNRYIMHKPQMVIGSDRLELYEFFGRRKEVYTNYNRAMLKLCIGLTISHAVLVEIPTQFSKYFGDEITNLEKKLGSED